MHPHILEKRQDQRSTKMTSIDKINMSTDSIEGDEVVVYTRKSSRYNTTMLIRYGPVDSMRETRGNVSAGGFCFESESELEPGIKIEVLFRLPGAGVWMSARGTVLGCYHQDDSICVRGSFTDFDMGNPEILIEWINTIARLRVVA